MQMGESSGSGSGMTMVSLEMEKAEELPDAPSDVVGLFSRREDNSIFVQKAGNGIVISIDGAIQTDADVEEVEVVVTGETTVYKDVTLDRFDPPSSSGTVKVQQKVEPGLADDIGEGSMVVAWGDKRGDRVVARVLVYTPPAVVIRK
jgi:hypothetical protein